MGNSLNFQNLELKEADYPKRYDFGRMVLEIAEDEGAAALLRSLLVMDQSTLHIGGGATGKTMVQAFHFL